MPASRANPNSAIISLAPTPATCAPTRTLSSLVVTKRTNPSVAFKESARPLPCYGNLEAFTSKPCALASA